MEFRLMQNGKLIDPRSIPQHPWHEPPDWAPILAKGWDDLDEAVSWALTVSNDLDGAAVDVVSKGGTIAARVSIPSFGIELEVA